MLEFPFSTLRQGQLKIISEVENCLNNNGKLMIHAPTGLGKTAAVIYGVLKSCMEKDTRILFLTSKHTHQAIVYETMRRMNAKSSEKITFCGINGKRSMCLFENNVEPQLFMEFCRSVREQGICDFYRNTFTKEKELKANAFNTLASDISDPESIMHASASNMVCPYEISLLHAKRSKLIVANYAHVFSPEIAQSFLTKAYIDAKNTVLVVDEAHSLPSRLLDINSFSISSRTLERARKEIAEYGDRELAFRIGRLIEGSSGVKTESKAEISSLFEEGDVTRLEDIIKKNEKGYNIPASFSLRRFVERALGLDENKIECVVNDDGHIKLNVSNLDYSSNSREAMEMFKSSILISGTFKPMDMFANLLGIPEARKVEIDSGFSLKNRLFLAETDLTSKFTLREKQFPLIAERCDELLSDFNHNAIFFFPSYGFMHRVFDGIKNRDNLILETPEMTREQKLAVIEKLSLTHSKLFAVIGGNFSESVGIKNNSVKLIVIVGMPLEPPSLRLRALQDFYQSKFGNGFEYAQVLPAMMKVMQAAGRAVRSEKDKAAILMIDSRFEEGLFKKYLPDDVVSVCGSPIVEIKSFGLD